MSDPNLPSPSRAGPASERYDPERHHRRSIRLAGYDYGAAGAYFVTVCTHGRARLLGGVVGGRLRVTEAGRLAWSAWLTLPLHYRHVGLDAFVVMPDHVHGIVWLREDDRGGMGVARGWGGARRRPHTPGWDDARGGPHTPGRLVGAGLRPAPTEPTPTSGPTHAHYIPAHHVPTYDAPAHAPSLHPTRPGRPAALPEIVRAFKSFSARAINGHRGTPGRPVWQRNYYEHIVRDAGALRRIRAYVRANPARWLADERRTGG